MSDDGSDWEDNEEVKKQKKSMMKVVVVGDAKTGKVEFNISFEINKKCFLLGLINL